MAQATDITTTADNRILAAGGILWRNPSEGRQLAVIHRVKHQDLSLPKGKLEKGESFEEAALREVREETACTATLDEFAGVTRYTVNGVPKEARFWNMHLRSEFPFTPNREVDELRWLTPADAVEILSYDQERELVRRYM